MFKQMWTSHKVSPDLLVVHADQRDSIDNAVFTSGAPLVRLNAQYGEGKITGGLAVDSLLNRYFGKQVPILTHPDAVPGTILAICQNLGEYYPNARIANNLEVRLAWDYRKIDYARSKRAEEFGIDCRGCLVNYAPFALGKITGVA